VATLFTLLIKAKHINKREREITGANVVKLFNTI
jgi:hypothetical protein